MCQPELRDRTPRSRLRPGGGSRLLALAFALFAASGRAEDVGDVERVQKLHREGRAARDAGNRDRALALLLEAWSIRKTPDGAASLAQVEFELGRTRDAAEHLAYACRHLPADADRRRVRRLFAALERIEQEVVSLRVDVEPREAEVRVNGRALGRAGELEGAIYAEPGSLTIGAELPGFEAASTVFTARAGERRHVRLRLRAAGSPRLPARSPAVSPAVSASPERERRAADTPSLAPSLMAFGAGGAALVASGSLWLAADSRGRAAERQLSRLSGSGRCGDATPFTEECAAIRDDLSAERDLRVGSALFLGVGVSAAVAGALLWPSAPVQGRAHASPNAFGAELEARF